MIDWMPRCLRSLVVEGLGDENPVWDGQFCRSLSKEGAKAWTVDDFGGIQISSSFIEGT